MSLKASVNYRAIKYGIPIKDLTKSFSSFKWIFNRVYIKNKVYSSFDYSLNNKNYLVLNNLVILFTVNNINNSFNLFKGSSIFLRFLLFLNFLFIRNLNIFYIKK